MPPNGLPTFRDSKPFATVVSDVVRIGDLIENAGAVAEVAIFRSPDIGSTGTVSTAKVLDAVGQHDLLIVDATGIDHVEITRDSRVISVRDIERRIARALSGQPGLGDPNKLTVSFDREPRAIFVESNVTADLEVTRTAYEPRTARFDVTFSLPGSAVARGAPLRYIGTIREMVEVADPESSRQSRRNNQGSGRFDRTQTASRCRVGRNYCAGKRRWPGGAPIAAGRNSVSSHRSCATRNHQAR